MNTIAAAIQSAAATLTVADERTPGLILLHPLSHDLGLRDVVALVATISSADRRSNGEPLQISP